MKKLILFSLFFVALNLKSSSYANQSPEITKLPQGTYQNSCKDCSISEDSYGTSLTCTCKLPNGQYNRYPNQKPIQPCKSSSNDFSCRSCENIGGALSCYDPHNH